jgi:hypothetical protein
MNGSTRTLRMPNGLEIAISESGAGLRLEGYRWKLARSGLTMESRGLEKPSEMLRSGRLATVEQLVHALQKELGAAEH